MADLFESLLAAGAGFSANAARRKRENEFRQLEKIEQEQEQFRKETKDVRSLLGELMQRGMISPESFLSAYDKAPERVRDRLGLGAKLRPESERPLTQRQRQDVELENVEQQQQLARERFESDEERALARLSLDRQRERRLARQTQKQTGQQERLLQAEERRTNQAILNELSKDVDDVRFKMRENNKILTADLAEPEDKQKARIENDLLEQQLRELDNQRTAIFEKLGLSRSEINKITTPITRVQALSKIVTEKSKVFKKMIANGLITKEKAIESAMQQFLPLIQQGNITEKAFRDLMQRLEKSLE